MTAHQLTEDKEEDISNGGKSIMVRGGKGLTT